MDCLFCNIIAGEIPSHTIYEDDMVIAILDITPVNPGHALVLPKKHYTDITETPDEVAGHLMVVAKKIAPAVVAATNADAFNLGVNTGAPAGQTVFHTHIHIMPRVAGDGYEHWHGRPYAEGEAAMVAEKIKAQLA